MTEIAVGSVFAGHRIEAVAGRGGMGVVYRATQLDLNRTVALKVIAPGLLADEGIRRRFLRESRVAASLEHPNVIPIHYAGEQDGIAYIAMRYVAGDDLRKLTERDGPLAPERAAALVAQVAAALDAAHAVGLVHRDVKPANVLVAPGDHVYLTDFGLAKHVMSVGAETGPGRLVGTIDYTAPEQIRGDRLDARTDVYALGCVLFFALSQKLPFPHEGHQAKLWAHLTAPPPAVSAVARGVPTEFDSVIARALAKEPEKRYPSAGDLGRAALAAAAGEEVTVTDERTVATGDAAPARPRGGGPEAPTIAVTGRGRAAPEASTIATTRLRSRASPAPASEPPTVAVPRRRGAVAAGLAVAAVALAVGVWAAQRGEGDRQGGAASVNKTATPEPMPAAIRVMRRPNAIAVSGGRVWAGGFRSPRLMAIDERTRRVVRGVAPDIGVGIADMAAGAGAIWVAVSRARHVRRVDPATGRSAREPIRVQGTPIAVAADAREVWVGVRDPGPGPDGKILRIDPRQGRVVETVPVTAGIDNLVLTPTGVWVLSSNPSRLDRYDPRRRRITTVRLGGRDASDLAYGGGALWATVADEDVVVRVDERTRATATIAVGDGPSGVGVLGGDVWVANERDSTLSRISLATRRVDAEPIPMPLNPFAVAGGDGWLWVTCVGDNVVQPVPEGFRGPAA